MSTPDDAIAVLGSGSWGTALAMLLSRNGRPAVLWGRNPEALARMAADRENRRYLPGIRFPNALGIESDLTRLAAGHRVLLIVVPSHGFRELLRHVAPHLRSDARIAWATKGLEPGTSKLLHEVVREELGERPMAAISGPTFAKEVAARLPTAVTVASADRGYARWLAERLQDDHFRPYLADDLVGVQLGGAVKNVLAIAAGIADGLGFGANTRAALITRGLAEILRLGQSMGGRAETFMGLAGLGDLVLTCTDDLSRNRRCGLLLGHGKTLDEALHTIGQVVEGVKTVTEVLTLARRHDVEMPITEQVHRVLYQGGDPAAAVDALLHRDLRPEAS
jgi:glycerol-3-phosphate dehydrogenase (NAD(P)+)